MNERLIPTGQARELLLGVVERLGLNPTEVSSSDAMQIQISGDKALIHLTAVIPASDFISIAAEAAEGAIRRSPGAA